MAHAGQKIRFSRIGLLGTGQRSGQFLFLPLFLSHDICHIDPGKADTSEIPVNVENFTPLHLKISLLVPHLHHKRIRFIF